ncbi:uncharacterized protein LOC130523259 isoform X1 [Takifugu flavidus]|uniref:uncharacterized protein LOC130523259 isoform X1 n=1 Tax=Takifugu flavidus TaxID=433684 RepID=UPI0025446241|nr:uncharacterized protein LOC130523259 isoform X1 [Takifugu flavidus]
MRSGASRVDKLTPIMNLLVLFILFFQLVPSKGTKQIIKFAGETVTLPSGVNGVLSQVFWSIFLNTTYIASYRKGVVKLDWHPQYNGRLDLNTFTGDLTIRNLMKQDARVYKVEFDSGGELSEKTIELSVKEVLLPPEITVVSNPTEDGWRRLVLICSSMAEGVAFTWQVNPRTVNIFKFESPRAIYSQYNITQGYANFTCTTTRGNDSTSSLYQDHPDAPSPEDETSPAPRDHPVYYFIVFLSGCLLTAILIYSKNKYDQHKKEAADVSS